MTICISNTTKQHFRFHYRLGAASRSAGYAGVGGAQLLLIPSGKQIEIGNDWSEDERAYFIRQLERAGGRDAAEVHGPVDTFHGLLFRDDHPISEDEIRLGHDAVVKTQEKVSVSEALRAAVGHAGNMDHGSKRRKQAPARRSSVSMTEEVSGQNAPTGDEVSFDIEVGPDGDPKANLPI